MGTQISETTTLKTKTKTTTGEERTNGPIKYSSQQSITHKNNWSSSTKTNKRTKITITTSTFLEKYKLSYSG